MHRTSLFLASLLVAVACDSTADGGKAAADKDGKTAAKSDKGADKAADKDGKTAAKSDKTADKAGDKAADKAGADKKEAPADPWAQKLDSRVLAESGLDVGSRLSAFDIVNCESGETYCQVCRFGGSPKIMAVGTPDDEAFREDLKNLDAIAKKYASKDLKAFAVITDIEGGKAKTPADVEAAKAKAETLRKELGLSIPVVVPAKGDDGGNKIWDEYYNITRSRTVMFADGRNNVKYSAVGPEDFAALGDEIDKAVAG